MSIDVSKLELGTWLQPPDDTLSAAKIEVGVWLIPNDDQNRYSKLELGVWLVPAVTTWIPKIIRYNA